jgi:predicted nucleotidyltransferase
MDFNHLKTIILEDKNIINAYQYGSRVYETHNADSDYDFIFVVNKKDDALITKYASLDANIYTLEEFVEQIQNHEISILECLFLPENKVIKNTHSFTENFNLDKNQLRTSISQKSSNSWVKGKKKFIVEKDFNPYVGKKSVWHAFRMLDFGTQIAKNGFIYDYTSANHLYKEIIACNSWEEIEQKYKQKFNEYGTEFKKVAPKALKM